MDVIEQQLLINVCFLDMLTPVNLLQSVVREVLEYFLAAWTSIFTSVCTCAIFAIGLIVGASVMVYAGPHIGGPVSLQKKILS